MGGGPALLHGLPIVGGAPWAGLLWWGGSGCPWGCGVEWGVLEAGVPWGEGGGGVGVPQMLESLGFWGQLWSGVGGARHWGLSGGGGP